MKISCIEPLGISAEHFDELTRQFAAEGHELRYYMDRKEDADTLKERMADAEVVVVSNIRLGAEVLASCPRLRFLSVAFTGLDHIDLAYCREHGIEVQNAAGYSTTAVSELAVGLMLDLLRHVTLLDADCRQGKGRGSFAGRELRGKTVGVVGTGAIGTATMRLLLAFGCKVLAYSRTRRREVEALGVRYVELDDLMSQSDIVTLHVPLTEQTHHLIDRRRLEMMKPTALLVNTARGNVVDLDALAALLGEGRLAGAATDVYEQEPPLPTGHPLLQQPRCLCLPHVGFATQEAFAIRADIVFDHVRQFCRR